MITASFSKWILGIWEGTWSHGKAKSKLLLLGQVLKLTIKPLILALVLIRAVPITMPLLWVNQFVLHVASNQLFKGTAYCKWIVILFSEKLSLRLLALVYVTSVEQFAYLLTRIISHSAEHYTWQVGHIWHSWSYPSGSVESVECCISEGAYGYDRSTTFDIICICHLGDLDDLLVL